MGSHRSSVGPSRWRGIGATAVRCLGLWVRCVEGVARAVHIPAGAVVAVGAGVVFCW